MAMSDQNTDPDRAFLHQTNSGEHFPYERIATAVFMVRNGKRK